MKESQENETINDEAANLKRKQRLFFPSGSGQLVVDLGQITVSYGLGVQTKEQITTPKQTKNWKNN